MAKVAVARHKIHDAVWSNVQTKIQNDMLQLSLQYVLT
jgi:hypothetical protein